MSLRGDIMLCKFKVKGYKCFDKEIELDLEKHNDYQFNKSMIKNGIINKAIIYGKNGSGKTNIGLAIFDIMFHLTDKNRNMEPIISQNYINMDSKHKYVDFYYEFLINNDRIIYKYGKESLYKIVYEKVIYNGKVIINYDYSNPGKREINIEEAKNLNFKYNDEDISIVKYICNNTILKEDNPLSELMDFVNGMLWFRSVDFNGFIGLRNTSSSLDNIIIDNNKLKDFSQFLIDNDINYNLTEIKFPTGKVIGVKKENEITTFKSIASSGTLALWLYYCWEIYFDKITFLFIDEFDATYHFELAANIVRRLNDKTNFQTILTSHNTYLMSNKLTRPDCTFIIDNNFIRNLSSCTEKELREAHNIEKLYREGAFIING